MYRIDLLRHGESVSNQENRFTGGPDVDLAAEGLAEATAAARLLHSEGCACNIAVASVLKRAVKALWTVRKEMDRIWISVRHVWRLNERHHAPCRAGTR